jgi:hypothetical protein
MNSTTTSTKITVTCPAGHRLRGGTLLIGKSVCCPKCHAEFVFAPSRSTSGDGRQVTDTGVMRILGEMPKREPTMPFEEPPSQKRAVTDTGVMRILGDQPEISKPASGAVPLRPCSRCGVHIPESMAVCDHCHCYVGVLPAFMRQLTSDDQDPNN